MSDTNINRLSSLTQSLSGLDREVSLPPVHDWNPDYCGEIDMVIKKDGSWHYMGTPIGRYRMVKLFSTVLRKDPDGFTYLVTPVEKIRIRVEDAHFVATSVETIEIAEGNTGLKFQTNMGDEVIADIEHRLWVEEDPQTGEPTPYLHIRWGLIAKIHRNVFYQLVEMARQVGNELVLKSGGQTFSLGKL